ncbi:MAG: DUF167 domain-containing protein [Armatimonadetes bacterium]|nr:DUF167 domain-containing protein [Armatimonadota bacterium]
MRLSVTVIPNARSPRVEPVSGGHLRVAVPAPAREGRANAALIDILAKHFGIPRSGIRIVRGASSRHKVVQLKE